MQDVLEFLEDGKPKSKKRAPANSRRKVNNSFIEKIEQKVRSAAEQTEAEKIKQSLQE